MLFFISNTRFLSVLIVHSQIILLLRNFMITRKVISIFLFVGNAQLVQFHLFKGVRPKFLWKKRSTIIVKLHSYIDHGQLHSFFNNIFLKFVFRNSKNEVYIMSFF